MIRNLLTTAWRSLLKNKFFSLLNTIGLAVGMAVFLLIAQYVHFERSYEDFIPGAENIYRVKLESYLNNQLVMSSAENYPGVGPALKAEFAEVTGYARLYNMGYKNNIIITNEDARPSPIAFKHRRFLYADSSFLPMMGYVMVAGDAKTALAHPFNAVISEKYARMYFGNEDPIGKSLRLQDDDFVNELVKVTGVFKDLPANTHLKFDVLFSYKSLFPRGDWAVERYDHGWKRKDMYTFITLSPQTDVKAFEAKLPAIVDKYKPQNKQLNQKDVLMLQPLKSIHLTSSLAEEPEANGDGRIVNFLSLIGAFVLIIAWINYVNLSTAKAMERSKEVGVRKVMGAFKSQLISQFLTESGLINLLSIIIAIVLVILVLPSFNSLSGLSLSISSLFQNWFLLLIVALWAVGTVLSGFYPAAVLSSFKPVVVLKGKLKNSVSGIFLRKSLVVFQFMASVALIAGTFIVYDQLRFMMNQDLGMNIDQVMVVERPGIAPVNRKAFNSTIDVFRDELRREPAIRGVAASVTIPGKQREYKAGIKKYGSGDDQLVTVRLNSMDYDFMNVFKMKLIAGRLFSEDFVKDQDTSVIVTESAARLLGFKKPEEAIGQTLAIPNFQWNPIIVGVVNDYHQVSFKKPLDPCLFYCSKYDGEFYSIRINTSSLQHAIDYVKKSWEKAFPGNPFEFFFLDDYFNQQYENERKFGSLFVTFAALAVVVGCLGLFGLSAYTATQRTKEIGIRKALGSSERGIFFLLSQEYLKLVGLAILVSTPLVWWVMNGWMQNFAYRTSISVFIFIIAGIMVLVVALLTISYQTLRAARVKPVDSLRYE
ncbi:MAG: acidobacterial duplicated orphan permease [Cytophagales bacterium]|jgi:putative ABC transport system permease protein|nr:ABC transporter permease [Bacteroidota bacterium]MBS1980878.1 ABC transporter permease [Bacteroidota bacterium]WHZ08226.1 MAG: acidobacterial duplicated orphan permease [Cytophagales bacterium]